jgi:heterodisulfide reductase subunit B
MRYALFLGCKTPYFVPSYEIAVRRVMAALEVELEDPEFNCCGYPMSNRQFDSYLLAAARNLAIAEAYGLDILTSCKCCFGAFKRAIHLFVNNPAQLAAVNTILAEEKLRYSGRVQIKHLLQVLHDDIGANALQKRVTISFQNKLKVAVMYGCHALRPSKVTSFDHPYTPTLIDRLVEVLGGQSVTWEGRLGCCGAPVREINPKLSLETIETRLREFNQSEADLLLVDCPHTQMQLDWAYAQISGTDAEELVVGTASYPQLLGLTMGISPTELGLHLSISDVIFPMTFMPRQFWKKTIMRKLFLNSPGGHGNCL